MAFGGLDHQHTSQPMADINMTPLIDVMLVLLVIFIITAPLLTHAIRLDLPKVAAAPARETPETITVSIDAAGKLYWNDAPVAPVAPDALAARLRDAAAAGQDPELHLRAARDTRYDTIAQVMGAAQQAGVARIGFVTDAPAPPARPSPPRGAPPSLLPQAQPQPPSPPPAASR
ncbi:biopolymer transport ExbD/TolR family protein [Burkholderia pseudomallei 576]|uniref:ExbD/TolR family protein n=2 Tax=Burkholderia pseudomallei TaxID=28450 RepID=UPI00018A4FE7|nr:biopolymer transporter ExbD [Burkholderia pseudomallei]AIO97380.1 biopolymer transport ExbD/TolR family protein [Burkholderia pseudomallei 576]EEC36200.1 transport energizing protein, ExbD/TolR family [Burkholderia pseudomallei 576]KGD25193.1 biopolymer transport ExbD/TolR family protein [Burkholderia pseudomallei]